MYSYETVEPNPFGNGIEFREGKPLWLARYIEKTSQHPDGRVELNSEALGILGAIWEPVAVVAIVGAYRRGKSWFANVLHGRHDGFALGSSVEGCTKGIWMWSQPFPHNNTRVIVLDCEGLEDPDQEEDWATKLFLLCLTLSSTFIYNIPGVLTSADVAKLYLMNDLQKFVHPPKDEKFLPRLVILLRDFFLKHKTEPKQHFMQTLRKVNRNAAEGIKNNFKDFDIYCLPHPGCRMNVLQNMHQAKESDLDEAFVDAATSIVKDMFQKISPKYINDRPMPGAAFCKFLQDIVEIVNSPLASVHLSIPDEYEKTVQFVAQKAVQAGLDYYKTQMQTALGPGTLPVSWDDFNAIHTQLFSGALGCFNEKVIGTLSQITKFMDELQNEIANVAERYQKDNSNALKEQIKTVAIQHWTPMVEKRLRPGMPETFESHDRLEQAFGEFELECSKHVIPCPEVAEILKEYRTIKYPEAREQMRFLGLYNEQLANTSRLEDELKQQQQQHTAELVRVNNELAKQRHESQEQINATMNAHAKIQAELQAQKEQGAKLERLANEKQSAIDRLQQQIANIPRPQPLPPPPRRRPGPCTIL